MILRNWYNSGMKELTKKQLNSMSLSEKEELILKLLRANDDQQKLIEKQKTEIDKQKTEMEHMSDVVRKLQNMIFGRSSEKDIMKEAEQSKDHQLQFVFNEAEGTVDIVDPSELAESDTEEEDPEEGSVLVPAHRRKRPKGKRKADLSKLQKVVREYTLSEEELDEYFGGKYTELNPDRHSIVEYEPAHFVHVEQVVHVYRGSDGRIIRADHPETLLKTSIATPSLAAGIMNGKYVNHLPLTRMETIFRNAGLPLSHQDMANWMMTLTERYMMLLYDRLKEELLSHHVIHADETPVLVTKDGRKAGAESSMIVYRSNVHETHPVVEYDYHKNKNAEVVHGYIGDFKGVLVCDGHSIYERFAKDHPEVTIASCWVHMRRGFAEIVKSAKKKERQTKKYTLASYAVKQIAVIYQLDNALWDLDREERRRERNLAVRKHVDAFFDWCRAKQPEAAPKSSIAKAFSYALKREGALKTFLDDPDVPLDNNPAERAIRPFCTGRNSWHIIDTVRGAQNSAVLYSIAETAKANNLVPYEYYKYILEQMLRHMDDTNLEFMDDLLPWSDAVQEKCSAPEIPKPEEMEPESA